jgi:hypothetical protein
MSTSIYTEALELASRALTQTRHLLQVAQAEARGDQKVEGYMLGLRLAPDMFTLTKQVQIVSDNAKGLASRISGIAAPSMPDTETTFEELIDRINATLAFVKSVSFSSEKTIEALEVEFPWLPGKVIAGHDYVVMFAIPNIFFHVSMVYANLRAAGVVIGKSDYLGDLPFYEKA